MPNHIHCALDIESASLDPRAELLAIGLVILDECGIEIASLCMHARPTGPVDPDAAAVNGYSPEEWENRHAVSLDHCMRACREFLGDFRHPRPIAHNATMDRMWLAHAIQASSHDLPLDYHWVCTMALFDTWRDLSGAPGPVTLERLAEYAEFWLPGKRPEVHHALDDARACAAGWRWLRRHLQPRLPSYLID